MPESTTWQQHWHGTIETMPLASLTTMQVGGPALVATVADDHDLALARQIHGRWLGKGANVLVGPDGVPDPVWRLGPAYATMHVADDGTVEVGGAFDLARLVGRCTRLGLAGLEALAGVPASLGGALYMNAGTNHGWIDDPLLRARVWLPDEPQPRWIERADWPSVYRSCGLPAGTMCLAAQFGLQADSSDAIRQRVSAIKQAKATSQPLAAASAGCMFKNPHPDHPAGRLIDQCGLKGLRCGDAEVSTQHANFIINHGRADAAMVCDLIRHIRQRVWQQTDMTLELEVQTWNLPDDISQPLGDAV